jgi:hypothetical protein
VAIGGGALSDELATPSDTLPPELEGAVSDASGDPASRPD